MTVSLGPVGRRLAAVRAGGDAGSALAIALVFLMIFGLWIGTTLDFASVGQRTTVTVRDEATATYAGGGALDGAINEIRASLTTATAAAGTTTCFTLPAGALDNASDVSVTCQPRSGSGASLGGSTSSQPGQAVLGLATAAEGATVVAGSALPVQGDVLVNKSLSVPASASLTSSGSVRAGTCSTAGTVTPACTVAAAGTATDPGWSGPSTASTPLAGTLPGCGGTISLSPGVYRSGAALQAVLSCASTVVWFQPGTYFFDFKDSTRQLVIGAGAVVVGGTASGWTPGTTAAASVPYPTASSPSTSACNVLQPGVDLAFGGDSGITVNGGRVQLCALSTSASSQHVVLRGMTATTNVTTTSSTAASGSSSANAAGAWAWDTPAQGAVVDGVTAHVKIPNTGKGPSKLSLTGFGSAVVPSDATAVSVAVTVTETLGGTGTATLGLVPGTGAAPAAVTLRDCPTSAPCPSGAFNPALTDTASFTGLSAAQVNGMSLDLTVTNPNSSPIEVWIDGITVALTYTLPVAPMSGTAVATPYVRGSPSTTPLLATSGATTVVALHGTVYAPSSVLDLGHTGAVTTAVDRGVAVRHLHSSMTPASGFTGPLISIPAVGSARRQVLLTATSGGSQLARADVTFADGSGTAGTVNGTIPTVNEWSIG